jgi:anti-anti-sigma factor
MTPKKRARRPSAALHITGEMSIFRAAELKAMLLDAPAPTEVDLSGVTEIDTAGLQLLVLAKRHAQAQGRELRLVGHSAAVTDVFDLLNVAGYFGDTIVVAAQQAAPARRQRPTGTAATRRSHES